MYYLLENIIHYYYCQSEGGGSRGERIMLRNLPIMLCCTAPNKHLLCSTNPPIMLKLCPQKVCIRCGRLALTLRLHIISNYGGAPSRLSNDAGPAEDLVASLACKLSETDSLVLVVAMAMCSVPRAL